MTPPAATAAARLGSTAMPTRERRAPAPARRRSDSPATRIPRRVSGPAVGRRVAPEPRAVEEVRREPAASEHSALGVLGRGRLWVALFAVGLAGLVFLQGELRDLNSSTGTNVQSITKLERQNAVLRAEISGLSSDRRIYAEAGRMGFVEPPVGSSKYLKVNRGDTARALTTMTAATSPATALADGGAGTGVDQASDPSGGDVSVGTSATGADPVATTAAVPDSGSSSGSALSDG